MSEENTSQEFRLKKKQNKTKQKNMNEEMF